MMLGHLIGRLALGVVVGILAVVGPGTARARPLLTQNNFLSAALTIAGPSPYLPGCEGAPLRSRVYRGSVVEPMLAADPRDSRHLVAVWLQDRIATSAALGVLTA